MTRSNYHERQEARRERLLDRAEKAEAKAAAAERRANEIASFIPLGQPILVGHHSEKRHRRDLDRIHQGHATAHAEREKAREFRQRAAAVGDCGISSDDRQATQLLTEKLAQLEATQHSRKRINAAWRIAGRPAPNNVAAWSDIAKELGIPLEELNDVRLEHAKLWAWSGEQPPFPGYSLSNANAEMRRLRVRIEELRLEARAPRVEEEHGICRLIEDPDDNRVRLVFPGKPDESTRARLKSFGFRWSPDAGAWQRHLNAAGRAAARAIVERLTRKEEVQDGQL